MHTSRTPNLIKKICLHKECTTHAQPRPSMELQLLMVPPDKAEYRDLDFFSLVRFQNLTMDSWTTWLTTTIKSLSV